MQHPCNRVVCLASHGVQSPLERRVPCQAERGHSSFVDETILRCPEYSPKRSPLGRLLVHIPWAAVGPPGVKIQSLLSAWEDTCSSPSPREHPSTITPCQRPRALAAISSIRRTSVWRSVSANCLPSRSSSHGDARPFTNGVAQGRKHDPVRQYRVGYFLPGLDFACEANAPIIRHVPQIVSLRALALQHIRLRVALSSSYPLRT